MKPNHPPTSLSRCCLYHSLIEGSFLLVSNIATAGVSRHQCQTPPCDASSTWHPVASSPFSIKCLVVIWCYINKELDEVLGFYHILPYELFLLVIFATVDQSTKLFSCFQLWSSSVVTERLRSETNEKSFSSGTMVRISVDYTHLYISINASTYISRYKYCIYKICSGPQLRLTLTLLHLLRRQTTLTLSLVVWSWFMIYSDVLVVLHVRPELNLFKVFLF